MTQLIGFIGTLIFIASIGYFLWHYLEGDYTIKTIEEFSRKTYINKVYYFPDWVSQGETTTVVHKITYESGKIKFKSYNFKS